MQLSLAKHPDLPDVPLIMDLAKDDEQRQMFRLIFARQVMGRPFQAHARRAGRIALQALQQGVHGHDERQGLPGRGRQG